MFDIQWEELPFFGPTITSLLYQHLYTLRHADRYWYENFLSNHWAAATHHGGVSSSAGLADGRPSNPNRGGSSGSRSNLGNNMLLDKIKAVKLSEVVLRNSEELGCIQKNVFRLPMTPTPTAKAIDSGVVDYEDNENVCLDDLPSEDVVDVAFSMRGEINSGTKGNTRVGAGMDGLEMILRRLLGERVVFATNT
eukprot:Platyproteum_vivax@DN11966_c0_g1_i1.p1